MDSKTPNKIQDFFGEFPVRKFKKGQVLIHAGDEPDGIINLVEGKVKQYDLTPRGDQVIVNVFGPSSFFPMSYAINRSPNLYYYEADSDVEIRKVAPEKVEKFIKDNPDVLYDLISRVYRGTDGILRRMTHLMASSAKERVAYELLVEGRRFGLKSEKGCKILLNESDIGARAGLTRETVSREIGKLKSSGHIVINGGHIVIPDLEKLEDIESE